MANGNILSSLIQPMAESEFLEVVYNKRPILFNGDRGRFSDIFSWESVAEIINRHPFPHPQIKMHREGRPVVFRKPSQLTEELRRGTTLILDNADQYHRPLANFVDRFSYEMLTPARTNAYMSFPGVQAFDFHYDTHNFFILQISGKKRWFIYPDTVESPLYFAKTHGIEPPQGEPLMEVVVSDGDVLYVPKGFWHYAVAEDEPSIHLTLALFSRTRIDFLAWVVGEVRELVECRRELPITLNDGARVKNSNNPYSTDIEAVRAELNEFLSRPEIGDQFLEFMTANLIHRSRFSFPSEFLTTDDMALRTQAYRRCNIRPYVAIGQTVSIGFHGNVIELPSDWAGVVEYIIHGRDEGGLVETEELIRRFPDLDSVEVSDLLATFAREGLLTPISRKAD